MENITGREIEIDGIKFFIEHQRTVTDHLSIKHTLTLVAYTGVEAPRRAVGKTEQVGA